MSTDTLPEKQGLYFVGIGGVGMQGVARCFHALGHPVAGSDAHAGDATAALVAEGIPVASDRDGVIPEGTAAVVRTAAVGDDHPQIALARSRGIPIYEYADALQRLMARGRGIAISGTHGKTTTTAMTAQIFRDAGREPSWVVGGFPPSLGTSAHIGDGQEFVVEACEYRRSFLRLRPAVVVCTSIEPDHLDCYRDIDDIRESFRTFFDQCLTAGGLLVVNRDDPEVMKAQSGLAHMVETYGLSAFADWRAQDIDLRGGFPRFSIQGPDGPIHDIELRIPGMHNVLNATAATAVAFRLGVPAGVIRASLKRFPGVSRRFEVLCGGEYVVIDDYAHHPTAIRTVLRSARDRFGGRRIIAVFQPHQHSRTRTLFAEFQRAFDHADRVVIPEIYACRDTPEDVRSVSALDLVCAVAKQGKDARYVPTLDGVVDHVLREAEPGDVIAVMGAGDVTRIAHRLASILSAPGFGGGTRSGRFRRVA